MDTNTYIQEKLKEFDKKYKDSSLMRSVITQSEFRLLKSFLEQSLQDAIKYGEGRMIKLLREEHPNACLCYKYKTPDGVWHLIQCDKCSNKLTSKEDK